MSQTESSNVESKFEKSATEDWFLVDWFFGLMILASILLFFAGTILLFPS